MRKERLIRGLNNSQKIRIIVGGIGMYTTVGETENICTCKHRMATQVALMNLVYERVTNPEVTGFGFNYAYIEDGGATSQSVDVQVNLVD